MWCYVGAPCAPLRLRLCSRFTRCAEVVAPYSIILRLSQSEWRMVDRYDHFPSSILHSQLKTPERTSFRGFSLSKKYYFNFYASCGSTHKIEFAKQIHKFREHGPDHPLLPLCGNSPCVSRNLYKGRKNVPVRARFFFGIRSKAWFRARDCSENVSFSTVSNPRKELLSGVLHYASVFLSFGSTIFSRIATNAAGTIPEPPKIS